MFANVVISTATVKQQISKNQRIQLRCSHSLAIVQGQTKIMEVNCDRRLNANFCMVSRRYSQPNLATSSKTKVTKARLFSPLHQGFCSQWIWVVSMQRHFHVDIIHEPDFIYFFTTMMENRSCSKGRLTRQQMDTNTYSCSHKRHVSSPRISCHSSPNAGHRTNPA